MKHRKFILIMLGFLLIIGVSCTLTDIISHSDNEPEAAEALTEIEVQLTEMAIEDEQEAAETSAPTKLPQATKLLNQQNLHCLQTRQLPRLRWLLQIQV